MNKDVENINTLFSQFNLKVDEVINAPQSIKYRITLPLDLNIQGKVRRAETNIKFALSSALNTNDFSYRHDKDSIIIERKKDDLQVVDFNLFKDVVQTDKLNLALGIDENGNRLFTDLSKAPHILVGGTTGSGKSELLHTFICSLIYGMRFTNVEICIIDPKRAEFSPYKGLVNINLYSDMDKACECLNRTVEIMEERYTTLEKAGVKDIAHYSGKMHPIVIVIDELADLILQYPESEKSIVRIAQKARACGIHLIIGTQSPRRDIVTGLIKANIPTKIALHTSNQTESRIILDQNGAEYLFGKGDMLYLANGSFKPLRIQSAYVDTKTKNQLINRLRNAKVVKPQKDFSSNPKSNSRDDNYDDKQEEKATKPNQKRVGLIQGFINLMKVKPIMFQSDEYPPKI